MCNAEYFGRSPSVGSYFMSSLCHFYARAAAIVIESLSERIVNARVEFWKFTSRDWREFEYLNATIIA